MAYSKRLRATILRDEGRFAKAYLDTVEIPTVGVGRNLRNVGIDGKKYESIKAFEKDFPVGLSDSMIDELFDQDLRRATQDAIELAGDAWNTLSEVRQEVLINMAFNLGRTRLGTFKRMWRAIHKGDMRKAAEEMRDSKWYRQVRNRAIRLFYAFLTNDEQCFEV